MITGKGPVADLLAHIAAAVPALRIYEPAGIVLPQGQRAVFGFTVHVAQHPAHPDMAQCFWGVMAQCFWDVEGTDLHAHRFPPSQAPRPIDRVTAALLALDGFVPMDGFVPIFPNGVAIPFKRIVCMETEVRSKSAHDALRTRAKVLPLLSQLGWTPGMDADGLAHAADQTLLARGAWPWDTPPP